MSLTSSILQHSTVVTVLDPVSTGQRNFLRFTDNTDAAGDENHLIFKYRAILKTSTVVTLIVVVVFIIR